MKVLVAGAVKLIEAAEGHGVRRYLMLSAMGVEDPEGVSGPMRPYLSAKAHADERLRNSSLDYTIVRPGRLTNEEGTGSNGAWDLRRDPAGDGFAPSGFVLKHDNQARLR